MDFQILNTTEALERMEQDTDLYCELIHDFIVTDASTVSAIQNFYQKNDYENLRSCSHRLKGVLQTIGAEKMSDTCRQIERMIKENRIDKPLLSVLVPRLTPEYNELVIELHKICGD